MRSMCALSMMSGGDSAMMSPRGADQHPALETLREYLERPCARLAGDGRELDARDQPVRAHVDDVRQALQRMGRIRPFRLERLGPREQPFARVDVQRGQAGRAGHRVRRIGVAVEQLDGCLRPLHEGVVDGLLGDDGAHRLRAVGQALGAGDQVRRHAELLRGERRAGAPEARDDFIEDQQDAVLVADLAQPLQVADRRGQNAGAAGDGLDDDRGDVRRIVQRHQALEFVRQVRAMLRQAAAEGVLRQVQRVRQVVDAGELRAEPLAVVDHAADGDAAEADAMVAALAADQARTRALAADAVVGQRDLERSVHSLAAGVDEERMRHAGGGQLDERVGEVEAERVAHLEGGRELHLLDLLRHGGGDLAARVASVDTPEPGHAVEHLAALRRPVVHAAALGQQARLVLELPVGGERHPEGLHLRAGEGGQRGRRGACVHGGHPVSGSNTVRMIRKINTQGDGFSGECAPCPVIPAAQQGFGARSRPKMA